MSHSAGSTDDGVSGQDVDRVHSLPPSDDDDSIDRSSDDDSVPDAKEDDKAKAPKKKGFFDRLTQRVNASKKKYYSSYTNGTLGVCSRCKNYKKQCNCHHCARCNAYMLTPQAKHHCRQCWMPICKKCSGHERVNNFMTGEVSNTCCDCALPMGIVSLTANSIFSDLMSANAAESNPEKDEPFRSNSSFLQPPPVQPFRWGLYILQGEMSRPRCCVNPSCTHRYSFKTYCSACQMPTISTAPTVFPHVDVTVAKRAAAAGKQAATESGPGQLSAVEGAAYEQRATAVRGMGAHAVDEVFNTYIPSHAEGFIFHGLRNQTAAARHVVLALIACGVANEVGFSPSVSLTFFNNPFTRLLRSVSTNLQYTIMLAPDKTCFIAFPELAKERELVRILSDTAMVRREVWNNGDKSRLGVIVTDEDKASDLQMTNRVTYFDGVATLWDQVESKDVLSDLAAEVLRYAQSGSKIVLCGHSLGGATASIIASKLLIEHTTALKDKLMCVTFGAPLVADKGLSDLLDKAKVASRFQHFVMGSDMFPRLAYLDTFLNTGTLSNSSAASRDVTPLAAGKVKELVLAWYSVQNDGLGVEDTSLTRGLSARDPPSAGSPSVGKMSTAKSWGDFFGAHFSSEKSDKSEKSQKKGSSKKSGSAAVGDEGESDYEVEEGSGSEEAVVSKTGKGSTSTSGREAAGRKVSNIDDVMSPLTAAGDIFGRGREPFDNDFVGQSYRRAPQGKPSFEEKLKLPASAMDREASTASADFDAGSPLMDGDFLIHATEEFRAAQLVEPYGCYNFLWKAQDVYNFSDGPARTIGHLCDRTAMRVLLQDHFMSAYWRGLLEYIHSIPC